MRKQSKTIKPAPRRLLALDLSEVSLVDAAANGKRFLVTKRNQAASLAERLGKQTDAQVAAILKSVDAVAKADGEMAMDGGLTPLSDGCRQAMEAIARLMAEFKDELTDAHLDALQQQVGIPDEPGEAPAAAPPPPPPPPPPPLEKADPVDPEEDDEPADGPSGEPDAQDNVEGDDDGVLEEAQVADMVTAEKPDGVDDTAYQTALEAARAAFAAALAKRAYNQQVSKRSDSMAQLSGFTPKQRISLEQIFKRDAAEKREMVRKLEAAQRELDERREKDLMRRCQDDAAACGVADKDKLVSVLKALRQGGNDKAADDVLSVVRQHAEEVRVAKSFGGDLFGEAGSRLGADPDSPEAQIEALARSEVQKSAGAKSYEKAYTEVMRSPEGKRLRQKAQVMGKG